MLYVNGVFTALLNFHLRCTDKIFGKTSLIAFPCIFCTDANWVLSIPGGGGGTSTLEDRRDLDLKSSLKAKFGARSSQVHQIRGKSCEILLPQDAKVGKESQFWGHI